MATFTGRQLLRRVSALWAILLAFPDKDRRFVSGFEIRNYTTSKATYTPSGIGVNGLGTGIQLLNNLVHNITISLEKNGNAFVVWKILREGVRLIGATE